MKKKLFLGFMLALIGISLFACGKTTADVVGENLSECAKVYYWGECDDFYVSLSSGEREKEYLLDGQAGEKVTFALLSVVLANDSGEKVIKVKLSIGENVQEYELELNTLNNSYMIDLERELSGQEKINLTYDKNEVELQPISNQFEISYKKALEIASKELEEKINLKKSYNNLNAECYLRVMDKKANNFDGVFWCFTVLNVDNESYSVIISTEDGEILAKSN